MKLITIIGARPQFIKAAVVSAEVIKADNIEEVIIHTGQHFDENMSEIFFKQMNIPKPKYNLNHGSLSHGAMTGRMIEEIEKIVIVEKPDWIIVYGDTNSTLAGALVASKLHVRLAHIEAGLRSYNMKMPEEINRIITDRISNVLFCTSSKAIENLYEEGYEKMDIKIMNVGDVMYDAALIYSEKSKKPNFDLPKKFALATIHRPVNTDKKENLEEIISAFNEINKELPVVLTVHPRTKKYIKEYNLNTDFLIIEPVGFLEMIYLLKNSEIVFTDSGGLQKETFFHKKPCITLRDETEWTELIDLGVNMLSGIFKEEILSAFKIMYKNKTLNYDAKPYGKGNAGKIIIKTLIEKG